MPNRLIQENSPYLLQHAENPVDWHPWGEKAIDLAKAEDKPIFLSIGYAACHWCHVMAHESFEDPETAEIMNQHFVNIKVDREERPDLDSIYMNAVVSITGNGGWPMSVFLTPEGKPFFGGTYFPPERKYNMPAFQEILNTIARLWKEDRNRLIQSGNKITEHLIDSQSISNPAAEVNPEMLERAAMKLAQSYDWDHGGWGSAPKFPQPMAIEFLLCRSASGDRFAMEIASHVLIAMAKGGMYDVIGGGFARYSTDDRWLVPHFEKMLYDNAQLARVYLHAYLLFQEPIFRRVCEETLEFIQRELMDQEDPTHRGFLSSLDADSDGEEGKYYIWRAEEIRKVLENAQRSETNSHNLNWYEFFQAAYGIEERGNFEGRTVLQRAQTDLELAEKFELPVVNIPDVLRRMQSHLRTERDQRVRPALDDKVLVSWNALALTAFAEAGRYLKRKDLLEVAIKNADFILSSLAIDGRLMRSWRKGKAQHAGFLEDYAGMITGLIALYQSDPDPRWFTAAKELTEGMIRLFNDQKIGFYDTGSDQETLLLRPKDLQDNATPSGNAMAAMGLLQMATYTGNQTWREKAEAMLEWMSNLAERHPTSFAFWLNALNFATRPAQEVVILGDADHPKTIEFIDALWSTYRPFSLAAISIYPPPETSPELLQGRKPINGSTTGFVCQNFSCKLPVNNIKDFLHQLEAA